MDKCEKLEISAEPEQPIMLNSGYTPRCLHEDATTNGTHSDGADVASSVSPTENNISTGQVQNGQQKKINNLTRFAIQTALDDAMSDADVNSCKTPVAILNEILARCRIVPTYEFPKRSLNLGNIFRYRVSVSFTDPDCKYSAEGSGKNKKDAKEAAALGLIYKLTGTQLPAYHSDVASSEHCAGKGDEPKNGAEPENHDEPENLAEPENRIKNAGKQNDNSVGRLQNLCVCNKWPLPTYDIEEGGLPHARLYTAVCHVLGLSEVGTDSTKQTAKHNAAQKMWDRLNTKNPLDMLKTNAYGKLNSVDALKNAEMLYIDAVHSDKIAKHHRKLENENPDKLATFQKNSSVYEVKLAEIADKNNFEIYYLPIDGKFSQQKFQCLLKMETVPVVLCQGMGDTMEEAKATAAMHALDYIKAVCEM